MTRTPADARSLRARPASPWIAALVAGGCGIVVAFQAALTLGAPLGAAALGGADSGQLPGGLRVLTAVTALVWLAFCLIVLARGNLANVPFPKAVARWGTWILVYVLGAGALVNFASSSAWERFGWGPFSLILCALSLALARSGSSTAPPPSTPAVRRR